MVHILAPQPAHAHLPIFFNVDAAVGANAPAGAPNDIMLVQYFLKLIGDNPGGIGAAHTATFKKVSPTGKMDQATLDAIKAAQSVSSITPDGRVSKATGYKYGAHWFTIVDLNFSIRGRFRSAWPNVDKLPGCPPGLGLAVRQALAGS
ncbi:peptidoglycan-binding domain-containing protein [Roseococcus sp. YIM B11640]|uniref:peptidoglycan-binding domain-containing protein n=1 Tax=Roseococcus sp. YIM B11640 TaxID=3133973 RepID=UPI003C79E525